LSRLTLILLFGKLKKIKLQYIHFMYHIQWLEPRKGHFGYLFTSLPPNSQSRTARSLSGG